MKNNEAMQLGILKIERSFDASVEEVFTAFTDPETMSKWFFGYPAGSAQVEVDLRVGGKYSITMRADPSVGDELEGKCRPNVAHHGEYLEISPPHRLAFTWIYDGFVDYSVVTIDITPSGTSAHLSLTHRVPTDTIREHNQGWNACLDNLEKLFA